ncbi:MAG: PEGA domain-containing protein [Lachnospiraceae bacterium]|nr:PEGA domain-containing protein [Lachnospiraceae bacterium]
MTKNRIWKTVCAGLVLSFMLALSGCSDGQTEPGNNEKESEQQGNVVMLPGPGSYDSADTAVITKIDKGEKTITFYNYTVGKKYTLNYDGTTTYSDKYGQALALAQIEEGDIVDITFLKSKKRLNTLQYSAECWENASVQRYEINTTRHDVSIGSDVYKITEETLIFSDGRQMELMDLNSADVLTFRGIGTTVHSIVVEKGHGYLRLANDEQFLGGWIEVGQSMIRPITDEMLLTVPEGTYDVSISLKNSGGKKHVVIKRNEEVTLDIGDLEVEETKYGQVLFTVTPSGATLYVDGSQIDASMPVRLEYGIHQLLAAAAGYDTLTSYFRVAEPSGGLTVSMTSSDSKEKEEEEEKESSTPGSSVATGSYLVYINAPEGAEVYVDGNYIGMAPVSFKKVEGPHVVTLRKTGYTTRSYTIQVDGESKDISYSFADLVPSIDL